MNTLIFDWDGTLANSIDNIVFAMQRAAVDVDLPVRSAREVRDIIGLALPDAVTVLYPDILDPLLSGRLIEAYADNYLALERDPSPLFDGVGVALEALRARGFHLAVATGKARRGLDRMLASHGLEDYFDITRCADETAGKPHPMMIEEILAELGVTPADTCMVGDSEFDIRMGHNAGVCPVAVTYGAMTHAQLLRCRPVHCVDSFDEFHGWALPRFRSSQLAGA
ncbi:phosphoglycolate phosphatase [Halopseudomonas litoralis]|uniref:Phosphoglycolate phosphatase n=1 Tax=Halopseudomonas litoralis TaxID=797277 RepID=A0A1H1RQ80_9GAMM|nr:HAD-IA family hydrolase [Halopseudomonas litoralis]SDS37870.1 phosphoglycolate phosphatase [Halopseudomonas litoralis]